MTDISKEAVDALIPLLNYGVCQDQYDDVEIYETEQLMKKAAQSLAALRAALDEAEARAVKAEAERDAANALLRRITRNVDADGVGTVLIIDLQAARAHLGAKP